MTEEERPDAKVIVGDALFQLGGPTNADPLSDALPPPADESSTVEAELDALIGRLEGYLAGPLPCSETAHARDHLQAAQRWLAKRTVARKEQHVAGTAKPHVSR